MNLLIESEFSCKGIHHVEYYAEINCFPCFVDYRNLKFNPDIAAIPLSGRFDILPVYGLLYGIGIYAQCKFLS